MTKTVFFICADETPKGDKAGNAGERDYQLAIDAEIAARGPQPDTEYKIAKITHSEGEAHEACTELPITRAAYAALPPFSLRMLDHIEGELELIGVGHSTFDTLRRANGHALHSLIPTQASWITHMVDNSLQLDNVVREKIWLLTPEPMEALAGISESAPFLKGHTELSGVPHTNTEPLCAIELKKMMRGSNRDKLDYITQSGEPFVIVIMNAGFPITIDGVEKWHPYTLDEAHYHSEWLGAVMEPGTNLVIVHGSPRNLRDDRENGNDLMEEMAESYEFQQEEKSARPVIVQERVQDGYDAVKACLLLGRNENCIGVVTNAEGYGTMDGAVRLLDNDRIWLRMFVFKALEDDPTGFRMNQVAKYGVLGIDAWHADDNGSSVERHEARMKTPLNQRDPAEHIVTELRLAVNAPRPGPRPRRPDGP